MHIVKNAFSVDEIKSFFCKDQKPIHDTLFDLLQSFRILSFCRKAGIHKSDGYSANGLITLMLLFPFFMVSTVRSFVIRGYTFSLAQKDSFFRLLNNENINWRRFLLLVACRARDLVPPSGSLPTCGVLDDTLIEKTGSRIEGVGKVMDHVKHCWPLGYRCLVYGFFNGKALTPLDFSLHAEKGKNKKKPYGLKRSEHRKQHRKQRDPKTCGAKRHKELKRSKIDVALQMIRRAARYGFIPKYILADSWFATKKLINGVRCLKGGMIHFLGMMRQNKQNYRFNGKLYTAKVLRKLLNKDVKRNRKWHARYVQIIVYYEGVGDIQLTFCRFANTKKWTLLVSTDTRLSFQRTLELYSIRWNIEVMFKECKQHLNLGKCQSNTFDAQIATTTFSFAMYTMLAKYKEKNDYTTIGALFGHLKEQIIEATLAERLWQVFLQIQTTIAEIFELDIFEKFNELIGNGTLEKLWENLTGPIPQIK